jgi:transcriptional regulator with GAF, ATPase, and Fis domain
MEVNCAALPETLLESELFGHVRGAVTGAIQDRAGRFEVADGGTLFLDEIADVSPMTQAKLLRAVQSRAFERVGDTRTRLVNVRLIVATNRDLQQSVRDGKFREDLSFRIKVFPIEMPPLRLHLDDLPGLLDLLLERFREQTGKGIRGLDASARRAIQDYCWPGNVRELENAIEFAFVTCQGAEITMADLPHDIRQFEVRRATCAERQRRQQAARSDRTPRDVLGSAADLSRLLAECGWNKAEVARRLGVSRTLVWKWMKKHGMPLRG